MTVAAMFCLGMVIGLGLGCQRGQTSAPSPVVNTASASTTSASPPAAASAPGAPPAEAAVRPALAHERAHVTLPKSPTSALGRTRRPFTSKQLAWLSSFEFKGFVREDAGTTDEAVEIHHTT